MSKHSIDRNISYFDFGAMKRDLQGARKGGVTRDSNGFLYSIYWETGVVLSLLVLLVLAAAVTGTLALT